MNVAIMAGVLAVTLGGIGPFSGTLAPAAGDEPSPQVAPLVWDDVPVAVDSGMRVADDAIAGEQVIFSEIIGANDAEWVRLEFGDVELAGSLVEGNNAYLRITSLLDGGVQFLNARSIIQWGYTSAYFNGRFVKVELIAQPGTGPSRVEIASFQSGAVDDAMQTSICDGNDDRQLSGAPPNEPDGRIRPVGCTGWLIGERCFLTAGHCTIEDPNTWDSPFDPNQMQVVEFNVPLSNPNGSINFSDPDDQYPIQTASIQHQASSCWDDWAQFAAFENSNTGLTPLQAQGTFYSLASNAPSANNQLLRVRGYGTTWQTNAPNEWSQVLTWHSGPYTNQPSTGIQHRVDTTGGNSGSAVYMFSIAQAIGIHTCGGCTDGGGANNGTAIHHPNLQTALANPLGGCAIDAHCPGSGNCCVANGSPGCNNEECCEMICAADPFCCNNTWDSLCANAANLQCPVCFECGHPNSGDCCAENDTPYCNHASCCNLVCADDPFCCNTRWDSICANTANQECFDPCFECGHGPAGSCCEVNGSPYCDDAACCEQICANDPFCCNNTWDSLCASAADTQCSICHECGHPATGDCCVVNGNAYCEDEACCEQICANDPFCCNTTWDSACANAADTQCSVCHECGHPATGDCCESNGNAYCEDAACCEQVCANDPFCCNVTWDSVCAEGAANVPACNCGPAPSNCPADLNGDGTVDGGDLLILLAAWGPSPGHPADLNGDGTVDGGDLLILLAAWGPCPEKVCDEGFVCGSPVPWCNEAEQCVCITTFDGSIECLSASVDCGVECPSGSCPSGQICTVNSCCNGGAPTCIEEIPCEPAPQSCDDLFECGVPFPDGYCEEGCICVETHAGENECVNASAPCGDACPDGTCPEGQVCITDTCCGATNCVDIAWLDCGEPAGASLHGGPTVDGNPATAPRPTLQPISIGNTLLGDQHPLIFPREMNTAPEVERGRGGGSQR